MTSSIEEIFDGWWREHRADFVHRYYSIERADAKAIWLAGAECQSPAVQIWRSHANLNWSALLEADARIEAQETEKQCTVAWLRSIKADLEQNFDPRNRDDLTQHRTGAVLAEAYAGICQLLSTLEGVGG